MIHYDLLCGEGHAFDGWFRDSIAFDQQAQRGQLCCPSCGASTVRRAPMAPRLNRGAKAPPTASGPASEAAAPQGSGGSALPAGAAAPARHVPLAARQGAPAMPDQMRAFLQQVRAEVERRCDYVGPSFAEEARRIHKGEARERPIYGETSPEQAEALEEDGIKVARVPWVPRADS